MLLLGAFLLIAATPAGSAHDSPGNGARAARERCLALEVSSPREARQRGTDWHPSKTAFSASRSLDLLFRTQLHLHPEHEQTHTLEFRVRAPRGFLYQSLAVPVSAPPAAPAARTQHRVTPAPQRSTVGVSATLPVAGTAITTNSLYGRWSVEPLLDGAPCGAARFFTLRP